MIWELMEDYLGPYTCLCSRVSVIMSVLNIIKTIILHMDPFPCGIWGSDAFEETFWLLALSYLQD